VQTLVDVDDRQTNSTDLTRPLLAALARGWRRRCPCCGRGALFRGYGRVADRCTVCGENFSHQRADDLPAYVTIFAVGHIIIPALLLIERLAEPPLWLHAAVWLPLATALALWLLPRFKGAVVGLQWAKYMHGFGDSEN